MPPLTTKRRTRTNLKTKSNQNCQKIEVYGSLTTKEFKKKHSSRLVGGAEIGSWEEKTHSKAAAGGPGQARQQLKDRGRWQLAEVVVPHVHVDKLEGTTGERDRPHNPGF